MLRDWSDEWKNARLALELRGDELYQGETLSVAIRATVTLDTTSAGGSLDDAAEASAPEAPLSPDASRALALEKLEARWRRHCDGALVDLKVVEPAPGRPDKAAPQQPSAPRTTLFHQESRLALLPLRPEDVAPTAKASTVRVTLELRCECTLRVRAEFWHRPLSLIARVAPNATSREDGSDDEVATAAPPLTSMLLNEAFTRTHIFGPLREQTSEPPNLTRRVEHKLRVAKPLVLKMETKFTGDSLVVIIARATNTHDVLSVRVLDLQLHINQFAGSGTQGSSASKGAEFRVAKAPTDGFPVDLQPHEQYNFVFIVEPTGSGPAASTTSSAQASSLTSQQSLLTLSWETTADSADLPSLAASLLQPITEHHTILWSPHPHRFATHAASGSAPELLGVLPRPPPLVPVATPAEPKSANAVSAFAVVRRGDRSCPLAVTLAPLHPTSPDSTSHQVGVVETMCVVVANRSADGTEFDLSLVVPPEQPSRRSWVMFEASHHLGRLRPGTIIRKSLRLVFLRHGRSDLNAILLFDHISRTWFLPASPSVSSAWDVFVHP